MSIAEHVTSPLITQNLHGVVRGKTIELDGDPDLPDGQIVAVVLRPLPSQSPEFASHADVVAFAREQQVEEYLPSVLEMTRRIFPSARRIAVTAEDDPEIANDKHIVIEVEAAGLNIEQALQARRQWCRDMFQCCPSTLVCVFRLGLEMGK